MLTVLPKCTVHLCLQGIDLEAGGRNKKVWRTAPKSENVYLKLLVKVRQTARRSRTLKATSSLLQHLLASELISSTYAEW